MTKTLEEEENEEGNLTSRKVNKWKQEQLKAGKLEVIYNIKTFTIVTIVVSNTNTPNSIESIKIQVALHFFRAKSQLNMRFTCNAI